MPHVTAGVAMRWREGRADQDVNTAIAAATNLRQALLRVQKRVAVAVAGGAVHRAGARALPHRGHARHPGVAVVDVHTLHRALRVVVEEGAVLAMGVDADHLYRLLKAFAVPSV